MPDKGAGRFMGWIARTFAATSALAIGLAGPISGRTQDATAPCDPARICGLAAPEDMVKLPDGSGVVVSRMHGGGGLDFVDVKTRRVSHIDVASIPQAPDPSYPCTSLQTTDFRSHGLSLKIDSAGKQRLYVARHGGRESVEVFRFGKANHIDSLQWIGCVILPPGFSGNSVTARRDGSFFVSSLMDAGDAPAATKMARLKMAQPSGAVLEWTPAAGFRPVDFGPVSGPNGLELSADERWLYVTGWASRAIWAMDLRHPMKAPRRLDVDFMPDNLRWADDGGLTAAGLQSDPGAVFSCVLSTPLGTRCVTRWKAISLDAASLKPRYETGGDDPSFGDVSTALTVDGKLWLSENHATDIAIVSPPAR